MINGWINGTPDVTQDIPRIIFTGGPSAFPVDIGMGSFIYTDSPGANGARNWGGLDASAVSTSVSTARFSGAISGNLTGSVTGLDELFRFDVGGTIQGDVRASSPGNGSLFVVEAASLVATRSILLDNGNITRVRVGGDCTGDIVATTGGIAQVIVDGSMSGLIRSWLGSIQFVTIGGELRSDVSPTTVRVYAQDGIRELTAASIAATVSANDNGGTGKLGRLVTTSGGCSGNIVAEGIERFDAAQSNAAIDIAGDLSGELCARSGGFKVPVRIRGNVTSTGKVRAIGGPLINNSTSNGRVVIDGSLNASGFVSIEQTAGLNGPIIINSASTSGTWNGDVRVGPLGSQTTVATGPHYSNLSADIGGGSVGLVPFHLHDLDCSPPLAGPLSSRTMLISEFCHQTYGSGECAPTPDLGGPIAPKTLVLRAYGPIKAESATSPPVTVRLYDPSTGTYNATAFEDYLTITLASPTGSALKTQIEVWGLSTQNLIEGEYHIRPKLTGSARLLCDGLTTASSVPFGEDFTYSFKLLTDCNRNGQGDATDIDQVPSLDIFREDMVGPNGKIDCCEPYYPDYNRDGNVDQDDIADLIHTVGGGGCP